MLGDDITTGAMDTSGDTHMKATGPMGGDVETMNPQDSDDYQNVVDIGSSVPGHREAVASMDAAKGTPGGMTAGPHTNSMNPSPYAEQQD